MLFLVLILVKNVFFRFEKGYKRFLFQVASKHTALIYKPFLFWTFFLDIHKSCLKGDSL